MRRNAANRTLRWGIFLLSLLIVCAMLADFLSPYDPAEQHREFSFSPPSGIRPDNDQQYPLRFFVKGAPYRLFGIFPSRIHLFGVDEPARIFVFGTDGLGRDVLSRVLHGARLSLTLAGVALLISIPLALLVGGLAGFYGGWVDFVCMRLMELFLALPALYLIIALRSAMPLGLDSEKVFLALVLVISLFGWANLARIVRGAALTLREREFVLAAVALGASDARILVRHLLPNLTGLILTQAALAAPSYILAEVTLSYLGLGVPEPLPSWGGMLASVGGIVQLGNFWWNLAPGVAIFLTTLTFYLLAEGFREWSDHF